MTNPHRPSPAFGGPLLVLMGGVCIGFAPIGLRLGLSDLGPQAIAMWRFALAAPILLCLTVIVQKRAPRRPNRLIIFAGTFFACNVALWHWALEITTVANSTFIVNLGNLGVGFLAWLALKDRPANIWFLAVIVAMMGAAALSLGGGEAGTGVLRGDLLAFAAAFFVSCYMLCSKLARRELGGLEAIFWLSCVESLVAAIIVLLSGETFFPESIQGFRVPLFLAVVVQVAGQGLIITGLGRTPAAIAGVMVVVQPVVAAIIAWILFDELLTGLQFGGAALILSGIWLAHQGRRPKPAA